MRIALLLPVLLLPACVTGPDAETQAATQAIATYTRVTYPDREPAAVADCGIRHITTTELQNLAALDNPLSPQGRRLSATVLSRPETLRCLSDSDISLG